MRGDAMRFCLFREDSVVRAQERVCPACGQQPLQPAHPPPQPPLRLLRTRLRASRKSTARRTISTIAVATVNFSFQGYFLLP